jgi:hypothetical protein
MKLAGNAAHMGEIRNTYQILVSKPQGKRPFGRPRSRWEDNIKRILKNTWWEGVDWIHLAQDEDR